jgi:hypothetical protein
VDPNREEEEEEEEGSLPTSNMPKAPNKQQVHVLRESQVQCVKMWQECISNLHNDLPTLEKCVSSFLKLKNKS